MLRFFVMQVAALETAIVVGLAVVIVVSGLALLARFAKRRAFERKEARNRAANVTLRH